MKNKQAGDIFRNMQLYEYYLVFPDGDRIETSSPPDTRALLDVNGNPHLLPLETERTLAYHVCGKRTQEERGLTVEVYFLEQMSAAELLPYVR